MLFISNGEIKFESGQFSNNVASAASKDLDQSVDPLRLISFRRTLYGWPRLQSSSGEKRTDHDAQDVTKVISLLHNSRKSDQMYPVLLKH